MFLNKLPPLLFILLPLVFGCQQNLGDDLLPSSQDQRKTVSDENSVGHLPGQKAADFSLQDIDGNIFTLSEHLEGGNEPADAVVLYFTMWCPICLSHSDHINYRVVPEFSNELDIHYVLVDYVSGTQSAAYASAAANGYANGNFSVVVDSKLAVMKQFKAAMGSTLVIHQNGEIRMNEEYQSGAELMAQLQDIREEHTSLSY